MPANQGTKPNWQPKADFQPTSDEVKAMRSHGYVPSSPQSLAVFLWKYAIPLPELDPYEHDKIGGLSVATDIAERIFQPGVEADLMVELYQSKQHVSKQHVEYSLNQVNLPIGG